MNEIKRIIAAANLAQPLHLILRYQTFTVSNCISFIHSTVSQLFTKKIIIQQYHISSPFVHVCTSLIFGIQIGLTRIHYDNKMKFSCPMESLNVNSKVV